MSVSSHRLAAPRRVPTARLPGRSLWRSLIALTGAALLALSIVPPLSAEPAAPQLRPPADAGEVRALVIGIDRYRHPKVAPTLQGAVGDALDVARALKRGGTADLTVLLDEQATASAARSALRGLTERARSGDLVVVTFAGHGTQDIERIRGSEPDGLDEYFVMHGFGGWLGYGERVRDDEMFHWLSRLSEKGVEVVFLADSCHGGGMTKAADPRAGQLHVRSITRVDRPELEGPGAYYLDRTSPLARDAERQLPPEALTPWESDEGVARRIPGLTFIAAVEAHQLAPEVLIPGEATLRGAASYAFARSLEGAADRAGDGNGVTTRAELLGYLRRYVRALTSERQSPVLEPATAAAATRPLFQHRIGAMPEQAATAGVKVVGPQPSHPGTPPPAFAATAGSTPPLPAIETAGPGTAGAQASNGARLLYDPATGDVVSPSGDVIAYAVGRDRVTGVVERVAAQDRLARLMSARPLDISITPRGTVLGDGARFVLTVPETFGRHLLIANLAGNGTLQVLFPHGNADTLIQERQLTIPLRAGAPFGTDSLIVVSATARPTELELRLGQLNGRVAPLEVAKILERHLPAGARVGIVTYQTEPARRR
ncbi:MAG: caspase family protein [Hyphomicrobiaceae bacterium]